MAVQSAARAHRPSSLPAHVAGAATPLSCTFEAAREEFERASSAPHWRRQRQRGRAAEALGVTARGSPR